jgi:hypothetical protein
LELSMRRGDRGTAHCLVAHVSYDAEGTHFARQTTLNSDATPLSRWLWILAGAFLLGLQGCGSYEDKRIRELLQEKGFGSRAHGDATRENYIGGTDRVQFLMEPGALLDPSWPRLAELSVPQPPAIDGTIFVPYVGPVYVLGMTELEAAAIVNKQLRSMGLPDLGLQARIVGGVKFFYAVGEVSGRGPRVLETDMTFFDAMFRVGWTGLANLGRVYLIRPDAEHPLVVDINFREMITSGLMTANIPMRERDIVYVPPTFLGLLARLLERLLQPLGLAVQSIIGLAEVQNAVDYIRGDAPLYFRY